MRVVPIYRPYDIPALGGTIDVPLPPRGHIQYIVAALAENRGPFWVSLTLHMGGIAIPFPGGRVSNGTSVPSDTVDIVYMQGPINLENSEPGGNFVRVQVMNSTGIGSSLLIISGVVVEP